MADLARICGELAALVGNLPCVAATKGVMGREGSPRRSGRQNFYPADTAAVLGEKGIGVENLFMEAVL